MDKIDKLKERIKTYKLQVPLKVTWWDASEIPRWHEKDEEIKRSDMVCVTVGQFIKCEENTLELVMSVSHDEYGNRMKIPLEGIKNIKRLR